MKHMKYGLMDVYGPIEAFLFKFEDLGRMF